jgi:pilus assembly protein CpaE
MIGPIRTLLVRGDGVPQHLIDQALVDDGRELTLIDVVNGLDSSWRVPASAVFDVLVVACADAPRRALDVIRGVAEQRPHLPIVVLHLEQTATADFMQSVFEAGADDIVTLPEDSERVLETLRKAVARKRGAGRPAEAALAPLISVVGPKGGTGKTVTVCNLGVALAQAGSRVVLVDLDLSFGDVALGLRLMPERTIHDLARVGGSIDAEKLDDFLVTHSSGTRALLAPVRPDQGGTIGGEFLERVFTVLRQTHDHVVVDTPAGFSTEVIAAVDNSTDLCVVGMLDAFSLKDTKLGLETLGLMNYRGRVHIILNRADTHVGISAEDVTAILGRPPDVLIPSDRMIPRSISEGVPIVVSQKKSPAARAYAELARRFLAEPAAHTNGAGPDREPVRRRLLRRA